MYSAMLGIMWYMLCGRYGGNLDEFPKVSYAKWTSDPESILDSTCSSYLAVQVYWIFQRDD